MITATIKSHGIKEVYRVDRLINRGEWFGRTWLIGIGCGFDIHRIVVEGDNDQDVIDTLTDSKYGHLIKTDELCNACQNENYDECTCERAGNGGDVVNLDDIRILQRCKVNYFVNQSEKYNVR
jgi:hypothetical protein